MGFRLFCYGTLYTVVPTIEQAKTIAEAHIRACPEGAMEWAVNIRWHECDPVDDLNLPRTWVSSAKGEWLDHRIEKEVDHGSVDSSYAECSRESVRLA